MNLDRKQFLIRIGSEELKLEVSGIAGQANAAVMGTYGGTTVLATVVIGKSETVLDYMPLTVDYEEKFYAAGKILGSRFVRRETRPPESAILSGRLIDRTIRPLFDNRIRRAIQVVTTVLSFDEENDPDFVALVTASAALSISSIPFGGPVAGLRVVKLKDSEKILINPKNSEVTVNHDNIEFDSFVAGPKGRINMIELGGSDAKKDSVLSAYQTALTELQKLIELQEKMASEIGKPKEKFKFREIKPELAEAVKSFLSTRIESAVFGGVKGAIYGIVDELAAHLKEKEFSADDIKSAKSMCDEAVNDVVHKEILLRNRRPDGRKLDEVRELYGETGLLPRTHGSAIFARGNTQALAVTTLASPGSEQLIETMEISTKKRFLLHYNFPSYSVGETGSFRGPGRRDIGHGALAEKAILPLIPKTEVFPYTIRVVSEILSSNGSSSMATVSATSMSLMDAGVPIRTPAAGIAMGLISDEATLMTDKPVYKVLTDIQGPEDHHGDMDFKVAGTKDGINAIQMDVKFGGVTIPMIKDTLEQGEKARMHILGAINKVIGEPRAELSKYAPRVLILDIDPARIGEVIGPGGKVINGIIKKTGCLSIDIEETGKVFVTGKDPVTAEAAMAEVKAILKEYSVGEIIEGPIVKILEFGAIVEFDGGRDGMIHVSELKDGFVKAVSDVVKVGDVVKAKIIKLENGRVGLSLKQMGK